MVSIEANIETTGGEEIQRVLREAGERQADLTGAWMQIQKQFQEEQAEVFSASGAAGGRAAWAALSEPYARWKSRHYPGLPILVLSGRLRDSLTRADAPDAIREITPDSLVIGSTRAVGKWWLGVLHHIGAGHLPKRKAIRVTPRQEKRWGDIIGRWLEGGE